MMDHFYSDPACLHRLRASPLGPHLDGFAEMLWEQGYSKASGAEQMRLGADLGRWLEQTKVGVEKLDEDRVAEFVQNRSKRLRRQRRNKATLGKLLQYLRQCGIVPAPSVLAHLGPLDRIVKDYGEFLSQERGLVQATLDNYLPIARSFLSNRFGGGKICLDKLQTHDVTGFILDQTASLSPTRVQLSTTVLRSFLGFLYLRGQLATDLAAAVPTTSGWKLAKLPQYLEPAQVDKLLSNCSQSSPTGRRDYAILLLLARLGLRAGEVVHLCLDNINWAAGEILIRGKGAREDRLPLLPEVGQALAVYLKKDRPCCPCRRVFIRMKAPHQGFCGSAAIYDVLQRALARADLHPHHKGVHLLRRSLATQMLRGGASLTQIGQVLRHQLAQTTELYAKVNLVALRALAQRWPGGAR